VSGGTTPGSEEARAGLRSRDPVLDLPPEERLKVHEIFYSLQGESTRAGYPCVLVRLTGCQMRCVWCDSEYAFYEGRWRSRRDVLEEVASFGCPLVELTGGEPLLQPGARPLLNDLCDVGYEVLLETGGGVDIGDIDPRVRRIVDVKCPDSGEVEGNRWENLGLLTPRDELKLVIASERDYRWARDLVTGGGTTRGIRTGEDAPRGGAPTRHLPTTPLVGICPVSFSPVWGQVEPAELAGWILRDRLPVRFQLQIHKLLWGAETRGV